MKENCYFYDCLSFDLISKYVLYLFVSIKNIFSIILQGRIVSPNCRLEESDDRDGIPGPLYGEDGDGCEEFDRISF